MSCWDGIQIRFHLGEPSGKQIREALRSWLPNAASTSTSEVACNNHLELDEKGKLTVTADEISVETQIAPDGAIRIGEVVVPAIIIRLPNDEFRLAPESITRS